jgi:hypothetical protein
VVYVLNNFSINFIFIDTNMYDEIWCSGEKYPESSSIEQFNWLNKILDNNHRWNIVVGHIPFIANPHKVGKDGKPAVRLEKDLYELISKNSSRIDLYMCADEHNQQYITMPGMPPEVIAGSGGAAQDTQIFEVEKLASFTKLKQSTFGFVTMGIHKDYIKLEFYGVSNPFLQPQIFYIRK